MSPFSPRFARRSRSRLWPLAAALMVLVQGWIALAPLAECHGVGMAAHVESSGAQGHFTHDESSCPSCAVLGLNAITPVVYGFAFSALEHETHLTLVAQRPDVQRVFTQLSRAPPASV